MATAEVATTVTDRSLIGITLNTTSEATAIKQRNALALASGTGTLTATNNTKYFSKIFNNATATNGHAQPAIPSSNTAD